MPYNPDPNPTPNPNPHPSRPLISYPTPNPAQVAAAGDVNDDSSLMRYEFLLALVKVGIDKYLR